MANPSGISKSAAGTDPKGIRATIGQIPLRLYLSRVKTTGIISCDHDNCYYERMEILSDSSVVAKSCKDLYGKFVYGKGFQDQAFGKTKLNNTETADRILKLATNDAKNCYGVSFWIGYNALLEIATVKHLPFNMVRLTDSEEKHAGKYAVHPDWAGILNKRFDPKKIEYIDKFDPRPSEIEAQIKRAGGFDEWRGQILWMPMTMQEAYPLTIFDSAYHAISTDLEIDLFKYRNVRTSFLASHMLIMKQGFESEREEAEFDETLTEFQGGRNAMKIFKINNVSDDTKPELIKVESNNNDKLFEYHEISVQTKIRQAFRIPKELIGEDSASGFESDRVEQARASYNSQTDEDREILKEIFEMFMPFATPSIRGAGNYAIEKLQDSDKGNIDSTGVEVEKLALNGAQISSLKDIIISVTFGEMPKDTAKAIVKAAFPSIPETTVNEIIDPIIPKARPIT